MLNEAYASMKEVFDAKTLINGQTYNKNGHVLMLRFSEGLLKARVKGSKNQIYNVHMDLKSWPQMAARCTCPVQRNCKHTCATLFALLARENIIPSESATTKNVQKDLNGWLQSLTTEEVALTRESNPSHVLIFLLTPRFDSYEHKILIKFALAKVLKKGGFGKMVRFTLLSESKKQYCTQEDERILAALLYKSHIFGSLEGVSIRNSEILASILATGHAFIFDESQEFAIKQGPPKTGSCVWRMRSSGEQYLSLTDEEDEISPLLLDEAWYLNAKAQLLGRLTTPYSMAQLQKLLNAPVVDLDDAKFFAKKLKNTLPDFPMPRVFKKRELQQVTPTPVIVFDMQELANHHESIDGEFIIFVQLCFDYAGIRAPFGAKDKKLVRVVADSLIEYPRDLAFEEHHVNVVETYLEMRSLQSYEKYNFGNQYVDWAILEGFDVIDDLQILNEEIIPQLRANGWQIEMVNPLLQKPLAIEELEWFSTVDEQGYDFFSYQLGILVDGKLISIVPIVADLIAKYSGEKLEKLPDDQQMRLPLEGTVLSVPLGRIKPLIRLLLQFGQSSHDPNKIELKRYQLLLAAEVEGAIIAVRARWQGMDIIRQKLQNLVAIGAIPEAKAPQGLKACLRDYQQHGLNWLQYLRQMNLGGILADDMGLGKTVQALAHMLYEKEAGRLTQASLIIAPTSLVMNWFKEAARFTPDLKVLVFHGTERHTDNFDGYDLIVSTYGLIQRDKTRFIAYKFYYLVLDEAQFIKNARTKTTQIIQQLQASYRLCLTGTPLENHLGELWSLFHFLMPGLLGDAKQFRLWFRTPIEKNADADRRLMLIKRVQPFVLRRSKNEVARELPAKTEMVRSIELVGAQRDLYEAIRMSMEKKVREAIAKQGLNKSHIILLDALLKLRQICCDPRLLSLPEAKMAHGISAKLEALMDLVDNLMEEGRRVLIFSQFTSMLAIIEEQLLAKKYDYLKLTGQTQNRQSLVDRFQEGEAPIFLISLKAGGTGLNLTKADTVIHYDPWWNPAVEDQATDRSHRIGQENPVFVYKLISAGTVEEAILAMQEKKRQLIEGVLSTSTAAGSALTQKDINTFFTPLT